MTKKEAYETINFGLRRQTPIIPPRRKSAPYRWYFFRLLQVLRIHFFNLQKLGHWIVWIFFKSAHRDESTKDGWEKVPYSSLANWHIWQKFPHQLSVQLIFGDGVKNPHPFCKFSRSAGQEGNPAKHQKAPISKTISCFIWCAKTGVKKVFTSFYTTFVFISSPPRPFMSYPCFLKCFRNSILKYCHSFTKVTFWDVQYEISSILWIAKKIIILVW